jgi:hypothetical protein
VTEPTLRASIQARLLELRREYQDGVAKTSELERQQTHLKQVMLRISGAIQALEEALDSEGQAPAAGLPPAGDGAS